MTNMELLDILSGVQEKYILEAQQLRTGGRKPHRPRCLRQLAAVIALILILTVFLNTAPGAAAVEYVKEKVTSLIEALFPPKKMTINIEGMEYEGDYAAGGVEPEATGEAPQPGFAIYYDVDSYTMVKEGDITYIRPYLKPMTREEVLEIYGDSLFSMPEEVRERQIDSLMNPQEDPSVPNCEIEIVHLDIPYEQTVSQERAELEGQWEITEAAAGNRITFSMCGGQQWDSPVEVRDYISDEQGGCFRITSRYYLEAAEGHGVRFAAIVDTFAVIPPQGSANSVSEDDAP